VIDVPDPSPWAGELLVEGIAVGVCGTDKEIARGDYGWAPPGQERLVLVHESFGRGREGPEAPASPPASGTAAYGIMVLTGVSSAGGTFPVDPGRLNRSICWRTTWWSGR
jgi:NADPH:quinone reductase-like Zn-dependent oxidoreductase